MTCLLTQHSSNFGLSLLCNSNKSELLPSLQHDDATTRGMTILPSATTMANPKLCKELAA